MKEYIVYLELARRGGEIYVGKKVGSAEIDFVVVNGERKAYYQGVKKQCSVNSLPCSL